MRLRKAAPQKSRVVIACYAEPGGGTDLSRKAWEPTKASFNGDRNKGELAAKGNQDILRLLGFSKPPKFPDGQVHERYIGFEYDLNQALSASGFRDVYNSENPENSPKGINLFIKVKEQIEEKKANPPEWVQQIAMNVRSLPENVDSVLEECPF